MPEKMSQRVAEDLWDRVSEEVTLDCGILSHISVDPPFQISSDIISHIPVYTLSDIFADIASDKLSLILT